MHQGCQHQGESGKSFPSGNQGKSRNFKKKFESQWKLSDLGEPNFLPAFLAYFCKNLMVGGTDVFLATLEISCDTCQICVMRSGRVREKFARCVRESQGIQIQPTASNPYACNSNAVCTLSILSERVFFSLFFLSHIQVWCRRVGRCGLASMIYLM